MSGCCTDCHKHRSPNAGTAWGSEIGPRNGGPQRVTYCSCYIPLPCRISRRPRPTAPVRLSEVPAGALLSRGACRSRSARGGHTDWAVLWHCYVAVAAPIGARCRRHGRSVRGKAGRFWGQFGGSDSVLKTVDTHVQTLTVHTVVPSGALFEQSSTHNRSLAAQAPPACRQFRYGIRAPKGVRFPNPTFGPFVVPPVNFADRRSGSTTAQEDGRGDFGQCAVRDCLAVLCVGPRPRGGLLAAGTLLAKPWRANGPRSRPRARRGATKTSHTRAAL